MAVRVVDSLQTDDIDVANDEPPGRSAGTVDLMLKVGQPRGASARPGQLVGLSDRQLVQQRVAVSQGLQPVVSRLLAITGRLLATRRRPSPRLIRRRTQCSRGVAPLRRTHQDSDHQTPALCRAGVARRELAIMRRRRLIARQRRHVASLRDGITLSSRLEARLGNLVALPSASIANVTRQFMLLRVAAAREVAIARSLILIGRSLIALGCALIPVRRRLVTVREGLIAISERLIIPDCPGRRGNAALLSLDRPVPRIRTIA